MTAAATLSQPTSAATRMVVLVDERAPFSFSGRLYSDYFQRALPFSCPEELLSLSRALLDALSFPQTATSCRSFHSRRGASAPHPTPKRSMESMKHESSLPSQQNETVLTGKKGTFVVQVLYRQNATWQGTVRWLDTNKTQPFRSVLELLSLMQEALGADAPAQWE